MILESPPSQENQEQKEIWKRNWTPGVHDCAAVTFGKVHSQRKIYGQFWSSSVGIYIQLLNLFYQVLQSAISMHSHPDCCWVCPSGLLPCDWLSDWHHRWRSRSSSRRWRPLAYQRPASRWCYLWHWPRRNGSLAREQREIKSLWVIIK